MSDTSTTIPAPVGAEPIIQLVGVKKSFGPVSVLKGVDLRVHPGKVTALVGDNGAGRGGRGGGDCV